MTQFRKFFQKWTLGTFDYLGLQPKAAKVKVN